MRHKIVIGILLGFIAILNVSAQEAAVIKSFNLTNDHIPSNDRRNDLNGNPCALIKVQVIDEIERVEGNKIGDIVKQGGVEKWIYMCKGSRNVRIHLKNHLPVKVMFHDYDINGLESNRVYELVLEIPDAQIPIGPEEAKMQKLTLVYTPKDAMVIIDSKPYPGDGKIEVDLPVGSHNYSISAYGYIISQGSVALNEFAPRQITENLVKDPSASNVEKTSKGRKKSKSVKKEKADKSKSKDKSPKKSLLGLSLSKTNDSSVGETKEKPVKKTKIKLLNKSFDYVYDGVSFRCKAKDGVVTITDFKTYSTDVTIPAIVTYEGLSCPVKVIDTRGMGKNKSIKRIAIKEGVQVIKAEAFRQFINLSDVSIPNSIQEIGKKAFYNNSNTNFNVPIGVSVQAIWMGNEIKVNSNK